MRWASSRSLPGGFVLKDTEGKSAGEANTQLEEVASQIRQVLMDAEEYERKYLEIASDTVTVASQVGELHTQPSVDRVREVSASLRSVGAKSVAAEVEFVRKRAVTSRLHELVVSADKTRFSPEQRSRLETIEADIRNLDDQDERLTRINRQLSDSWRALEGALTTAYAELREERQRVFENRMQILGAVLAAMVAVFTIVSTLKTIGLI